MKSKYNKLILNLIFAILLISGCSKNDATPTGNELETTPVIGSITSDKAQILYGGSEQAIITCKASGGNLKYVWQVDLGDLIPMNSDHSKVSYTGAACCVGDKVITCTVSNSMGSVSKSITVNIYEVSIQPEIITIESDKTEIITNTNEKANVICYAIGGNLKYKWEVDCGDIAVNPTDNSKIVYTPVPSCLGIRTIKCTVSNDKGSISSNYQVTIK